MTRIGIAQTDITPKQSVWLTGYGHRDHKSEGVYLPLQAGAVALSSPAEDVLILTADLIGYDLGFSAAAKMQIAAATGLLPHQIVLTATHTHCAPFFYPWIMPGSVEKDYAAALFQELVHLSLAARNNQVEGRIAFSRGTSTFGVNRRMPDGKGGIIFGPNPEGPIDRALDTLWFTDREDRPLGSLSVFGCHPTSLGNYLIGGDYPGFLCRALSDATNAPALFATGCAGNVRPWFNKGDLSGFARPSMAELEDASRTMAGEVLQSSRDALKVEAGAMRINTTFHQLPYTDLPTTEDLAAKAAHDSHPLQRQWAQTMLSLAQAGHLPHACPQEIQLLQFNPELSAVFLGGEILTEIGLHIKEVLQPSTTITAAYSNGLIGYVPARETYDLGGYEVNGSHFYFLRPAPFVKEVEELIVARTVDLASS